MAMLTFTAAALAALLVAVNREHARESDTRRIDAHPKHLKTLDVTVRHDGTIEHRFALDLPVAQLRKLTDPNS